MKILKLPPEEWKTIPDLPFMLDGEFEISNHGRIRRISNGRVLKGGRRGNGEGWYRVFLSYSERADGSKARRKKIIQRVGVYPHRMVWRLFGNRPLLPHEHLYHINKCQDDNYIWNLAPTNRRFHKRRIARWKKEGKYYNKRPRRYFNDRTFKK